MLDQPLNTLTAAQIVQAVRDGVVTSEAVTSACLQAIDQSDGALKAWAHIDREAALSRAKAMDALRMSGRPMGRLHGVPVGLKDIIDTKSMPTECGTPIFGGRQPEHDANVTARLEGEGAVILGKTVTTEMAFMHPSQTRNPHDQDRSPGGSSSGSAAAVAAGHVPVSIGSQTNGSMIRPASFNGVFGIKPTSGLIGRTGVLQTSQSLDQLGVFARTLEDVALVTNCVAGHDPLDANSRNVPAPDFVAGMEQEPPVEPALVWFDMPYHDRLHDDAREGLEAVLDCLGGSVERLEPSPNLVQLIGVQGVIHKYEYLQHLGESLDANWDLVSDTLKPIIEDARAITKDQYEEAIGVKASAEAFFASFFEDYDAVIAPSANGEAPLLSEGHTGDPIHCTIWTTAGLPCLSMPMLSGAQGLPVGVQLIGAAMEDDRLMRTARWSLTTINKAMQS